VFFKGLVTTRRLAMETEDVCYTREVAIEKAIEMETKSFELYKGAYKKAQDRQAKDLLKDLALDELRHKYTLEKAFFEEIVMLHDKGYQEGLSMNLSLLLAKKPLDETASVQDVMISAIHDKKRAVDYYKKMAEQCGGAPMAKMFKRLYQDEESHLARLEELYETHYLQEM
jgi:rubrerythrin